MNCPTAAYDTEAEALLVKRTLLSRMQLYASIIYCERCNAYHVPVDNFAAQVNLDRHPFDPTKRDDIQEKQLRRSEHTLRIIELLAHGFTMKEIGAIVGVTEDAVDHHIRRSREKLYAVSSHNLIAIAIAHGILDPRAFVPQIIQKEHS